MANTGSIIFSDELEQDFISLRNISDNLHYDIVSGFSDSNVLYNMSSVMEDIVLDKYLAMYNTAKTINISNILRNNIIIESFTSRDYFDLEFPVDQQLNLDTQNGALTLPIEYTKSLPVDSIILGAESNGNPGNSFQDNINSDIKAILNSNSTGMFEYELISNSWKAPTLYLATTLKLKQENIANGVYIKLYAEDGMLYPKIESVKFSLDGETWKDAPGIIDINKADHYIRFSSENIRFVKVLLSQTTYYGVDTIFGTKNRYFIGVREIAIKQTTYKNEGEYVSKAFSSGSIINGIAFRSKEQSDGNIRYFVSADNGSKWVSIKDKERLQLNNIDMGLIGEFDIKAIRIKILMSRMLLPMIDPYTEYLDSDDGNKYFLTHAPSSTETMNAWLGGHISCGDNHPYEIHVEPTETLDKELLEDPRCVIDRRSNFASTLKFVPYYELIEDDLVVKVNGMILRNDRTTYNVIPHTNPIHSIIVFNSEAFLSRSMPESKVEIYYENYLHDNRTEKSQIIKLPESRPALVPTKDGVSVIAVKYGDVEVLAPSHLDIFDSIAETHSTLEGKSLVDGDNCWVVETGDLGGPECIKQYTMVGYDDISSGYDFSPSVWTFEGSHDGVDWIIIDRQRIDPASWDGKLKSFKCPDNDCSFSYLRWRFTENSSEANDTTLKIAGINIYSGELVKLERASFDIVSRSAIEIKKISYSTSWDYLVEYMPGTSINTYLPETLEESKIELQGLPSVPRGAKICFEYEHQEHLLEEGKDFYTPVCNEYRIELL